MIHTIFTRMKKEEPKPEEGKEVSTFNLSAMMISTTNIVNANDSTVFNNEKTGTSRRISKG